MESTKSSRGFLLAVLLVAVVGLTALDIYQDLIIRRQRDDLRWLMTHSVIRLDAPVPDASKPAPAAQPAPKNDSAKASPANVALIPPSAKPAAPAPASKP
jgi:hypothetical protein